MNIPAEQHVNIVCVHVQDHLGMYTMIQVQCFRLIAALIPLLSTPSLCLHILIYSFMRKIFFFLTMSVFFPMRMAREQNSASIKKTEYKNIHIDPEEINKE